MQFCYQKCYWLLPTWKTSRKKAIHEIRKLLKFGKLNLAGAGGLEPSTNGLENRCSIRWATLPYIGNTANPVLAKLSE